MNESKVQEGVVKQKLTFDQLLNKYAKVVPKDRSLKKTPRSPLHQGKPAYPRGEFSKCRRDVTTLFPPHGVFYYAMGAAGIGFFLPNVGARRDLDAMLSDAAFTISPKGRRLQKTYISMVSTIGA